MKKIFSILFICITVILGCVNVSSEYYPNYENMQFTYYIENNEVTIITGTTENIVIPDYIEEHPVTKIHCRAFFHNDRYKSIILPETLVTIEDEAIISCENIKEITIPKSVQNIGEHALGYILTDCSDPEYMPYLKYLPYKFRIKGYKGTAAETYANENGFKFVALDDEPDTTTATTSASQTTTASTMVSTTSTPLTTTTSSTTITTNSTTTSLTTTSVSASMSNSSTSDSTAMTTSQTTAATTTITTTTNVKGDANGDNKLDVRDAAFIAQKIALDKASELPKCADFNDDGTVNVRDAATIARYLASNVKK